MEKKSIRESIEYSDSRFTKRVLFNVGGNTVFLLNFMPGQELPTHKHPGSELFLCMLNGKGTLIINGTSTEIGENEVIHASGEEEFAFKNSSNEPASLYVTLCNTPSEKYAQNI